MKNRLSYGELSPKGISALTDLEKYIRSSTIEHSLLELVKLRASLINGCAFCIDMHTKDARKKGESEQRLYTLSAWREAPFYTEKERAALEWTEAVTKISEHQVTDELFEKMKNHFSEKEIVDLTLAVIAINGWNRLAISFHSVAGSYEAK
ncbi:MAG: carboxymuconolactone decarboxylase family protein [Sphaerochaetaceae bacterium]|jgi:AhpD family alkylhydroperoxidase